MVHGDRYRRDWPASQSRRSCRFHLRCPHLFVVEAKRERAVGLPKVTLATVFEVVANGRIYRVGGAALQQWIVERRQRWNGPKGYLFTKRPGLEEPMK
jgi:hypothetical protein